MALLEFNVAFGTPEGFDHQDFMDTMLPHLCRYFGHEWDDLEADCPLVWAHLQEAE